VFVNPPTTGQTFIKLDVDITPSISKWAEGIEMGATLAHAMHAHAMWSPDMFCGDKYSKNKNPCSGTVLYIVKYACCSRANSIFSFSLVNNNYYNEPLSQTFEILCGCRLQIYQLIFFYPNTYKYGYGTKHGGLI
jgi:hypothetical protein